MKRVLVVDDQQLVLLSLQKCLSDLGYFVFTSNSVNDAIAKFDEHQPDLVIVDINMPVYSNQIVADNHADDNQGFNGLNVIEYIKKEKKSDIPVMILSGNLNQDVIEKGFALGAIDYMKKPLSLNEIGIKVKQILGNSNIKYPAYKNKFIKDKVIGIVVPCYNVEETLQISEFRNIVNTNLSYHICFVNDCSTDKTLDVLYNLKKDNEGRISVYNCEKNKGNAEAIRIGMLHLSKQQQFDYIGFLDSDLSTNFDDFDALVETIKNSNFKIVSGSRLTQKESDSTKQSAKDLIKKTKKFIIKKTLGLNSKDTQFGAKIMTKDVVEDIFQTEFLTKSVFDVEIFKRMKKIYGKETAKKVIV